MNVASLIEWLQTMPQDATVQVLSHTSGSGYYDQGGWCTTEDFTTKIDYQQWKDEGDTTPVEYIQGEHFELSTYQSETVLQIGVMNK